jgi:hypothetical protein
VKDQHAQIKGYRDLDEHDIAITNHIKAMEENTRVFLNSLHEPLKKADPEALRWLAIARTHLETGFMFAIKAVTRPANGLGRSNADNRTLEEIRAESPVETSPDHSD